MLMNFDCIIVEDEKGALENLTIALESHPNYKIIDSKNNIKDGLSTILKNKPQLIFLDVELGQEKSFDLIDQLHMYFNQLPHIIMTTAHDHYGKEALNNGVLYFLSKPIDPDELQRALFLFEQEYTSTNKRLLVKTKNDINLFHFDEVMYLEGEGNYTIIHKCDGQALTTARTLKHYQRTLPNNFVRIHKKYIINNSYLSKYTIKTKSLMLNAASKTKIELPIGEAYFTLFKSSIG